MPFQNLHLIKVSVRDWRIAEAGGPPFSFSELIALTKDLRLL
jgi:hypothetical protein